MNRPHALPLLLAAAVVTAGCGGPDRPLKVGFKEVPSNVILGAQSSPTPEAPTPDGGATIVYLPPPSVVTLPPPPFEVPDPERPLVPPPAPPPAPRCVAADPLQAPAREAPPTITGRPVAGQYLFRNEGTFEVSGADAQKGSFAPVSLRTVSDTLEAEDGSGFLFSVEETLGQFTTETVYQVVTSTSLLSPASPGLYILQVSTRDSTGEEKVFSPSPSLPLATFPLTRGASVEARGVDATTATVMSYTATVTGKQRVDACGEPLDSWTIDIPDGRVISPSEDVEFARTYALGTQYGGIVLHETGAWTGRVDGAGVSRTLTSTISQEPLPATGPQP